MSPLWLYGVSIFCSTADPDPYMARGQTHHHCWHESCLFRLGLNQDLKYCSTHNNNSIIFFCSFWICGTKCSLLWVTSLIFWHIRTNNLQNDTKYWAILTPFLLFLFPEWRQYKTKSEEIFHQLFFSIILLRSNEIKKSFPSNCPNLLYLHHVT